MFWVITPVFNPAGFNSIWNNYRIFAENLSRQKVNLLTVECTFNDDTPVLFGENVHHLHCNSIMWQKERLINYGISQLPTNCDKFAWIDCDVLFANDDWPHLAVEKLNTVDIIQLFKRVTHLPKGHTEFQGEKLVMIQGVVWQKMTHRNWLRRRKEKELPFSAPGFAWAARRDFFTRLPLYDRNIVGSGDTFLVDCMFDSWDIHGYASKFTPAMKIHMMEWYYQFKALNPAVDYIPMDIYHLWHGSLKNRAYMDRHHIILENNYDPHQDIVLCNNVYEWASNKPAMHSAIRQYFHKRREDETD